jgi:hypothetical protein
MRRLTFVLIAALLGSFFIGCSPYEEGPAFSVIPKNIRAEGIWEFDHYTVNGEENSLSNIFYESYDIELVRDGSGSYHSNLLDSSTDIMWEFGDDKETIKITNEASFENADEFEIVRLSTEDMWLMYEDVFNNEIVVYYKKEE